MKKVVMKYVFYCTVHVDTDDDQVAIEHVKNHFGCCAPGYSTSSELVVEWKDEQYPEEEIVVSIDGKDIDKMEDVCPCGYSLFDCMECEMEATCMGCEYDDCEQCANERALNDNDCV